MKSGRRVFGIGRARRLQISYCLLSTVYCLLPFLPARRQPGAACGGISRCVSTPKAATATREEQKMTNERADLLGRMRIASPCPANWEGMEGDERVRFCRLCDLHVYNISEMTRAEAESLVARTEGRRLCARLYRRADGTVLTKDCPTGLRAVRRRVGRTAGAALAAVLSLCGGAFGQGKAKAGDSCDTGRAKVSRALKQGKGSALKGVVLDPNGAVITGAGVMLADGKTQRKFTAATSDEGAFEFDALPAGVYQLEVSVPGFRKLRMTTLAVGQDESVRLDLTLDPDAGGSVTVGVIAEDTMLNNGNGVTAFGVNQITKLPYP
jgi:hypothetical protein